MRADCSPASRSPSATRSRSLGLVIVAALVALRRCGHRWAAAALVVAAGAILVALAEAGHERACVGALAVDGDAGSFASMRPPRRAGVARGDAQRGRMHAPRDACSSPKGQGAPGEVLLVTGQTLGRRARRRSCRTRGSRVAPRRRRCSHACVRGRATASTGCSAPTRRWCARSSSPTWARSMRSSGTVRRTRASSTCSACRDCTSGSSRSRCSCSARRCACRIVPTRVAHARAARRVRRRRSARRHRRCARR